MFSNEKPTIEGSQLLRQGKIFSLYLIPYTAPIVHLLTTAWPPTGCWIPLGSPVGRVEKSEMSFHRRLQSVYVLSVFYSKVQKSL